MRQGPGNRVTYPAVSASPALVSIIIPAYNHAGYVAAALRSALAQSHPQIELIVIDDGSADQTAAEISRVLAGCRRDLRIEFIRQPNRGLAATLIRALALAQGQFVQFLASDDALFPDMTARMVAAFDGAGPEVAAIACDGYVFDGAGRDHLPFSALHPWPVGRNLHRELQVSNWLPAMGLLYRRDVLLGEGGIDPGQVYEDWALLLTLSRRFRILRIPDRLFLYRQHESNTSKDAATTARAHQVLCARYPAMRAVRDWKQALRQGKLSGALAGVTPGNLDLALRFGLRLLQRRLLLAREGRSWSAGRERDGKDGGRVRIGPGCVIGRGAVLEAGPGDLVLGPGCRIGPGARLTAGAGLSLGAGCHIAAGAVLGGEGGGEIRLGRACLIAEGARIAPGTVLGDLTAVGPGLAVQGTYPAGTWILTQAAGICRGPSAAAEPDCEAGVSAL